MNAAKAAKSIIYPKYLALNSVFYLDTNVVFVEAFKRGLRLRKMGSFFPIACFG